MDRTHAVKVLIKTVPERPPFFLSHLKQRHLQNIFHQLLLRVEKDEGYMYLRCAPGFIYPPIIPLHPTATPHIVRTHKTHYAHRTQVHGGEFPQFCTRR